MTTKKSGPKPHSAPTKSAFGKVSSAANAKNHPKPQAATPLRAEKKASPPTKKNVIQQPKPVQNKSKPPVPWTPEASKRIQHAEAVKQNGTVHKDSFAAEAMSRTAKHLNTKVFKIDL
jgi:hypothetical protein